MSENVQTKISFELYCNYTAYRWLVDNKYFNMRPSIASSCDFVVANLNKLTDFEWQLLGIWSFSPYVSFL